MAARGEELNTRITATDEASAIVDRVADKVGELEDEPHDVRLGADTAEAESELKSLDSRLSNLTDEEQRVILSLQATNAQRDIDKLTRDLANAHKFDDDEIALRIEARGNAFERLDAIQADIRAIDGKTANIDVQVDDDQLDTAQTKFRELDGKTANIDVQVDDGQLSNLGGGGGGGGFDMPLIISKGGAAAAGAGAAAAAANSAAGSAAETAISAAEIANMTGATLEDSSRLLAVWRTAGFDVGDLLELLLQMNGTLAESPEIAERLKINLEDGRDPVQRLLEVAGKLNTEVDSYGERAQLSSKLFGEEGVRQVNRVTTVVGDLDAAVRNVPKAQVITPADLAVAKEYMFLMMEVNAQVDRAKLEVLRSTGPTGDVRTNIGVRLGREIAGWFGSDDDAPADTDRPGKVWGSRSVGGGGSVTNQYILAPTPGQVVAAQRDYAFGNGYP